MINNAIKKALKGEDIIKDGDGKEIRNYINVLDAARLTTKLLSNKYINKNVNIFGNESKRVRDVMNIIKNNTNKKIKIKYSGIFDSSHYKLTPFTFKPRKSILLKNNKQIKLENGIIELIKKNKAK